MDQSDSVSLTHQEGTVKSTTTALHNDGDDGNNAQVDMTPSQNPDTLEKADYSTENDTEISVENRSAVKDKVDRKESIDEAYWLQLCQKYRELQGQESHQTPSQKAFLQSQLTFIDLKAEPKYCRTFSRYLQRYESEDLNLSPNRRRRRTGKRKGRFSSHLLRKQLRTQELDARREKPSLKPLARMMPTSPSVQEVPGNKTGPNHNAES